MSPRRAAPPFRKWVTAVGVAFAVILPAMVLLRPVVLHGALLAPADTLHTSSEPWRTLVPSESRPAHNPPLADRFLERFPRAASAYRRIRSGDHPLWNPLVGAGTPLLAAQDVAALAPWNVLASVLPPERARGFLALAALVIAALGAYAFLRSVRIGPIASTFGATTFSLSAAMVLRLGDPESMVAAWLGWLLFATERLFVRRSLPGVGLLAILTAMVWIGGHFGAAFHAILAALLYAAIRLAGVGILGPRRRGAATTAALVLAGHVVGVGLALPYLWPAVHLLLSSGFPGGAAALPPEALVTLLAPAAFGYPVHGHPPFAGPLDYASLCLYLGVLPLCFALAGAAAHAPRHRDWWSGLLLLGVGAAALAGFSAAPLLLPAPVAAAASARFALPVVALAAALLAARGLEPFLAVPDPAASARARPGLVIGTGVLLAGGILVAGLIGLAASDPTLTFRELPRHARTADLVPRLLVPLAALLVAVLAVAARAPLRVGRVPLGIAVIALGAFDLVWAHRDFQTTLSPAEYERLLADASLPADWSDRSPPVRMVGYGPTVPPDLAQLFGVNDARAADPQTPDLYRTLWSAGMVPASEGAHLTRTIESPVLDLLAVGFVIAPRRLGRAIGATVSAASEATRFLSVDLKGAPAGGHATLFTRLEGSRDLPQGTLIADVVFRTAKGLDLRVELRAGENTGDGEADPGEAPAHRSPPAAIERYAGRNPALRVQRVFAAPIDLGSLPGTLEVMEIEYRAPRGQLHVERFSPGTERPGTPWSSGGALRLTGDRGLFVYENLAALPWARVVHSAETVGDPQARLDRLLDPAFDRAGTVLLEAPFDFATLPEIAETPAGVGEEPAWVRVVRHRGDAVDLEAALPRAGFLVIADLHAPGWQATVQGQDWPLLRVDHALRGVPLPRGGTREQPYRIHLEYVPAGYRAGLWCALVAGFALLLLFLHPVALVRRARAKGARR